MKSLTYSGFAGKVHEKLKNSINAFLHRYTIERKNYEIQEIIGSHDAQKVFLHIPQMHIRLGEEPRAFGRVKKSQEQIYHYLSGLDSKSVISEGKARIIKTTEVDTIRLNHIKYATKGVVNTLDEDEEDDKLLEKYGYLPGGDLKLASEGRIQILPGENEVLNKKANIYFKEAQKLSLKLKRKTYQWLEKSGKSKEHLKYFKDFECNPNEDLAKTMGVLEEYKRYRNAIEMFKKIGIEARDDFVVESVANHSGEDFIVPVVFGAAHDFERAVLQWNTENPNQKVGLSRVIFK